MFLSDAFRHEEPELFNIVKDVAALPQSKWRVIRDMELFVDRTLACRARNRRYQTIGLFACTEAANVAGEENMFTKSSFVKFAAKLAVASNGTKCLDSA